MANKTITTKELFSLDNTETTVPTEDIDIISTEALFKLEEATSSTTPQFDIYNIINSINEDNESVGKIAAEQYFSKEPYVTIDGVQYKGFQDYRDREENIKKDKFYGTPFQPLMYLRKEKRADEETRISKLEDDERVYFENRGINYDDYRKFKKTGEFDLNLTSEENIKSAIKQEQKVQAQNYVRDIDDDKVRNEIQEDLQDDLYSIFDPNDKDDLKYKDLYKKALKKDRTLKGAAEAVEPSIIESIVGMDKLGVRKSVSRELKMQAGQNSSKVLADYLKSKGTSLTSEISNLNSEFEKLGEVTENSSQEKIQAYNSLIDKSTNLRSKLNKYSNNIDKISDAEIAIKAFGLEYNFFRNAQMSLDVAKADIETMKMGLAKWTGLAGQEDFDNAISYNQSIKEKKEVLHPLPVKFKDVNMSNLGETASSLLSENIFSIGTAFSYAGVARAFSKKIISKKARDLAGKGVVGLFFTVEGGAKLSQLEMAQREAEKNLPEINKALDNITDENKRLELQKIKDDYEKSLTVSEKTKAFSSITHGGVAGLMERLGTMGIINRMNRVASTVGPNRFKNLLRKGTKVGFNAGIEYTEEAFTQIFHNLGDNVYLDENKSLAEGIDADFNMNVLFSALAIQAGSGSMQIPNVIRSEMSLRDERKKAKQRAEELIDLKTQLDNIQREGIYPEFVPVIKEKINKLLKEAAAQDALNFARMANMTNDEVREVLDNNKQIRDLLQEASQEGEINELGKTELSKRKLQEIKNKINVLVAKNEELGKKPEDRNQVKLAELFGKDNVSVEDAFYYGQYKNFMRMAEAVGESSGKYGAAIEVETQEDAITQLTTFLEQGDITIEEYEDAVKGVRKGSNGMELTSMGTTLLVADNVANNIRMSPNNEYKAFMAYAPFHETQHLNDQKVGIVKGNEVVQEQKRAVQSLFRYLLDEYNNKKISKKQYETAKARLKQYRDSNTNQIDLKELKSIFGEFMNAGIISKDNPTIMLDIKSLLNGVAKSIYKDKFWLFRMNTAEDVLAYIRSFQKQVIGQKLQIQAPPEEQVGIKESLGATPLKTIDALVPNDVKTKEDFLEFFSDPKRNAEIGKALAPNGIIDNYVKSKAIGDEYQDAIDSIRDRVFNFNPQAKRQDGTIVGRNFGEFIFANTRFGKLDARKALAIEAAKKAKEVRIDAKEAKEVEDKTTTDVENNLTDDKITKVNVLQTGKIASKEGDIIKVVNEKGTFRDVIDNNKGKVGSIIFGIPANKIANPEDNITTSDKIINPKTGKPIKKGEVGIPERSEATNIQDYFADINTTKSFIRILNPTNVTEKDADVNKIGENIEVSRDVLGRAIGLPNRILKYFYQPKIKADGKRQRSQGLSSQVPMWELKPGFRNLNDAELTKAAKQFQKDLGITEKQEVNKLPTKENRSKIGQLLKGAAVVVSQQASLSAAQRKLEKAKAPKKQIADVTAAQSKVAFSLGTLNSVGALFAKSQTDPNFNLDLAGINKLNTLLVSKGLNETLNLKKDILTVDGRKRIVDTYKVIMATLGPKEMWFGKNGKGASVFTTSNKDYGISMSEGGAGAAAFNQLKQDLIDIRDDENYTNYGAPIKDKNGKILTDYTVGGYGSLLGNPNKAKVKNKDGSIKKFNEKVSLIHETMWNRINDLVVKDRKNAPIVGTYLKLVANHTGHWHKLGAQIAGWSTNPVGVGKTLYEYEHAMPATAAYLYLMHTMLDPKANFKLAYKAVIDNYKLIALDKAENAKLGLAKLGRSMPKGWRLDVNFWWQRYFNQAVEQFDGGIDPNSIVGLDGKTFGKMFNIKKPITKQTVNKAKKINKAIVQGRKTIKESVGITVLDFDDTLATTKSLVKYTTPDGKTGTLNAEQYAKTYEDLLDKGYVFDFSDFNKVVKGKLAPLFNKAIKLQGKFGPENMFVLTARPPAAQKAIFDFLKANGLNIPLKNITGLGNSTAEAKALWVADKVGEGYNDFYFADDALQNVQAVKNMLDQFDVKSKVQQARVKFSKGINDQFNNILENVTGIDAKKRFSDIKARKRGASKGKFRFFIPPSHEDFVGLLYNFMGKGKQGNAHRDFFEQALIRPLNRAYRELNTAKQSIANDYKSLNKQFPNIKKKLTKKTPDGDFTFEDAIRVYLFNKHGHDIAGLSTTDQKNLVDIVMNDAELRQYAETLNVISKQDKYITPTETWETGNIRTDLDDATGRIGRAEFFTEFNENADIIFSPENMNKIEAAYGAGMVSALKDILYRTKTGTNRPTGQNKMVNQFMNYLNGSVGATMFFNIRSAVLQQMSMVNFINFADNNVFAAAKAFANQKQYWTDWATIFNSDFMKQRRKGIQTDVNGAELAASVRGAKNPIQAVIKKLLELGFLPTQIGDNIAIATGGATFLRNRINTYLKQGLSQKEAEAKAFIDFQGLAEATQQSARPDMVSQQQASPLGKIILAFQNVTSQFNRLGKKAFLDLKNRRVSPEYKNASNPQFQSDIGNVSRIAYYFAIQNLIFYSLQSALFMAMFDDDEEDERFLKKKERMINGSIDSVLRGSGVWGAAVATLKNMAIKWYEQREKGYNADESAVLMEMLNVSPPLGIKARKLVNAEKTLNYNTKVIKEMETFDIDNPQWSAVTNYVEATTNVPLNRLYNKTVNVRDALDSQHGAMERALMFAGWSKWNLGIPNEKIEKIKKKQKFGTKKKTKTPAQILKERQEKFLQRR